MARRSKVQSSAHAALHVVIATLLLVGMQPVFASAEDGGFDTAAADVADNGGQTTKQIPKPMITYIPSSKSDPACGSGKRATVVKYSDGEKVGETEKKCIPTQESN